MQRLLFIYFYRTLLVDGAIKQRQKIGRQFFRGRCKKERSVLELVYGTGRKFFKLFILV